MVSLLLLGEGECAEQTKRKGSDETTGTFSHGNSFESRSNFSWRFGLGRRPGWWNHVAGQQGAATLAEGNLLQVTYRLSIAKIQAIPRREGLAFHRGSDAGDVASNA